MYECIETHYYGNNIEVCLGKHADCLTSLYCTFCEIPMQLCLGHSEEFSEGQPLVGVTLAKLKEIKERYK